METKEEKIIERKIAEWKEAYGDIYRVEVDGRVAYLKKPTRKVLGAAAVIGKTDPMKHNEVLLNGCWMEGDEVTKKDGALFPGAFAQFAEIIGVKETTLKKL